jgi:hypothetical protein
MNLKLDASDIAADWITPIVEIPFVFKNVLTWCDVTEAMKGSRATKKEYKKKHTASGNPRHKKTFTFKQHLHLTHLVMIPEA